MGKGKDKRGGGGDETASGGASGGAGGGASEHGRDRSTRVQWQPWLDELTARRQAARAMGGPERVEKYMHSRGKLTARQRLEYLFDPGTFVELGTLVGTQDGIAADAFVCGHGKIDHRPAYAGAEDFTTLGGSIGSGGTAKRYRIAELAARHGVPLVMMLEGAGHRLTDTGASRAPNDLLALADLGGQVPMVCLVMGSSAGHSAITAPLSDFVVMTGYGAMFTGGPPLVQAATGEEVTKQELGGPQVCAEVAGTVHNIAPDDQSALDMARRYLSYLPSNSGGAAAPRLSGPQTQPRICEELLDIISPNDRQPYDMRQVIEVVVDGAAAGGGADGAAGGGAETDETTADGSTTDTTAPGASSFFEIQPDYGRSLICGLARLGGHSVALVANNPAYLAGALDSTAAIKGTDFIGSISAFGLPVIFLADNPGVMAGTQAEQSGILRWGGQMFKAQRSMKNPKIQVTMRKAFGFGAVTMGQNPFDHQSLTLSLPSVNMAAMPADSGGRTAKLDQETQAEVEASQQAGPYRLADRLGTDEVIDPRELRNALLAAVDLCAPVRQDSASPI